MRKDETGKVFGRLTVISFAGSNSGKAEWNCICECGKNKIASGDSLRTGKIKSCGCFQKESRGQNLKTHAMSRSPTYRSWQEMKQRCFDPSAISYPNYGARGISICKRWMKFENFLADLGVRPEGTSLERNNNSKGYSKSNCRWASRKEQNRNKRSNVKIKYRGKTKCLSEWCEELKLPYPRTYYRISNGWSPVKAFETPFVEHKYRQL